MSVEKLYDNLVADIENGMHGYNSGIPISLPSISKTICNLQKGTYYLFGGDTGSGKTAIVDQLFLYDTYKYTNSNLNSLNFSSACLYLSWEIAPIAKLAKFVNKIVFAKTGKRLGVAELLSKGDTRKVDDLILSTVKDSKKEIIPFLENITMISAIANDRAIEQYIIQFLEKHGKFLDSNREIYSPNDKNKHLFIILDHIGLSKKFGKSSLKEAIDDISKVLVKYRNIANISPVVVSQFNRNHGNDQKGEARPPLLLDFKDTGSTQEDANVVFGIWNPGRYNISMYNGYPISNPTLGDFFRSLHVLKNRDGRDNLYKACVFHGDLGYYRELPKPDQFNINKLNDYLSLPKSFLEI